MKTLDSKLRLWNAVLLGLGLVAALLVVTSSLDGMPSTRLLSAGEMVRTFGDQSGQMCVKEKLCRDYMTHGTKCCYCDHDNPYHICCTCEPGHSGTCEIDGVAAQCGIASPRMCADMQNFDTCRLCTYSGTTMQDGECGLGIKNASGTACPCPNDP